MTTRAEALCKEIAEMEMDMERRRAALRSRRSELHRILKEQGTVAIAQEDLLSSREQKNAAA